MAFESFKESPEEKKPDEEQVEAAAVESSEPLLPDERMLSKEERKSLRSLMRTANPELELRPEEDEEDED